MKWILFSLLTLIFSISNGQKNNKYAIPRFQKLDIKEGLSNSNVSSIIQDDLGYIWIATARGINRYDGRSFEQYLHSEDGNSLYNDMMVRLHKNNQGIIFCSTAYGVNIFDTKKNRMQRIGTEHGSFIDFVDTENKTYGISYPSGLCVYNTSTNAFDKLPHINNDKLLDYVIADDKTGVWAKSANQITTRISLPSNTRQAEETNTQFLINYNPKHNEFTEYAIPGSHGIYSDCPLVKIDSLILLRAKEFTLFNINTNVFSPTPKKWSNLNQLKELEIWSLELIDNTLWVGTRTNGLYIFSLETNTLINLNKGNSDISSNFIKCIFKDRDENMWLGSFDRGVNIAFIDRGNVNYDISLNKITKDKFINSITSDDENNYYIGSRNDGFYIFNSVSKQSKHFHVGNSFLSSNHIRTIFVDSRQKVWVADQKALHIIDQESKELKEYYIPEANEGMVAFCELEDKVFACSDFQGIFIFDLDGNLIKRDMRMGSNISQIVPLNQEELIVASYTNGIFIYSPKSDSYRNIYNPVKTAENNINQTITIYLDSDNTLWIGNYMNGLHQLNLTNNSVRIYSMKDGLPNNDVVGIVEDELGALWLSTSYGISRFDKENEFLNFFYNEGLENLQFHARSAHIDNNGIVYFSACNGLSYFDPLVLSQSINKQAPKIILESITIQNKEITPGDETELLTEILNQTSEIKLKHNQNSVTIEYHAFDYVAAEGINYSYMLEGLDKEWNNAGKRSIANFSNLNPGNYTFRVKAQNNKGVWSEVSSLQIKIKPSPFLSIWAFVVYFLFLSTVLYITFQLRLRAKLYKSKLEFEHNERVRENEVAEMKMRFFTNISHEIRTPLTLIKGNVDILSQDLAAKNISFSSFKGLSYSTDRLLSLVNQLLSLRKLENDTLALAVRKEDVIAISHKIIQPFLYVASSRNITIEIQTDFDKLVMPIDEDKLEKILSNLISNSLKHAKEKGSIIIKIDMPEVTELNAFFLGVQELSSSSFVKFSVIDNGEGIPKKDLNRIFNRFEQSENDTGKPDYSGTGIGLDFTKRLVELHHGVITAKSIEHLETCFTFVLPFDEKAYKNDVWLRHETTDIKTVFENKTHIKDNTEHINKDKEVLVLVVEDDLELNRFICSSLRKRYKVISCFNGKEGIELAQNQLPSIIISDIMMPHMDGFELCKRIRDDALISHIPIILLTAKTDAESRIYGYQYGADDYISKPFEQSVLIARINNLIESRKKLQAFFKQGLIAENNIDVSNPYELNFIKKIETIIAAEYHSPKLNVNTLAKNMHMSRTNFYRKFTDVMDVSPKDFITRYRINKATELIKNGNENFGEISVLCGFGSQSNFTVLFKKEKGITPLQFKKSL